MDNLNCGKCGSNKITPYMPMVGWECKECGKKNYTEAPRPEDSSGSAGLTGCMAKGEKELKSLLNALNKVTAQHRHGMVISKTYLDNLANRQLEYLESL